jgi:type II secretion system protein G
MKSKRTSDKGFTLIELLVVIAIIGLLSSVVMASLNSARAKARDARRISDLRQIRTALELYYDDHNGTYPSMSGWATSCDATWTTTLQNALAPYMSKLPVDPRNNCNSVPWVTGGYTYAYYEHPVYPGKYDLVAQLEDQNHPQRCAVRQWLFHAGGGELSWCTAYPYSPYLYADH